MDEDTEQSDDVLSEEDVDSDVESDVEIEEEQFFTVKTYKKLAIFWSFQGVKNGTLFWNGLSCSLLFIFNTKFILVREWYILNPDPIL